MLEGKPLGEKLLTLAIWFGQVRRGGVAFEPAGMAAFEAALIDASGEAARLARLGAAPAEADIRTIDAVRRGVDAGTVVLMPTARTLDAFGLGDIVAIPFGADEDGGAA